jgi:IS30 family transposase
MEAIMANFKHFTLSERINIEYYLKDSLSFKAIGRKLDRDCTSISKEIKKHIITKKTGAYGKVFNNCRLRFTCSHSFLCCNPSCKRSYCKNCAQCYTVCSDFKEEICALLSKPPYVCNACSKLLKCTLKKSFYNAHYAQKDYELHIRESHSGITIDEGEIKRLDNIISPLILRGQSIHHICANNSDSIMHSERVIYNYVDYNLFSARNIDLPRKVRYRPRKKTTNNFKVDKSCRIGRTYEDFISFIEQNPDTPIVQMDTVEGTKGGKVLLTIHFTNSHFMLAFLRSSNTSQSVIDVFEQLYLILGSDVFKELFPIILTDNGSEFSNPLAIEFDKDGKRRTTIFFCEPSSPYQKGAAEKNHEFIRMVIPKGHSMNSYSQEDIIKMMNHINSYGRNILKDKPPYLLFNLFHGTDTLKLLDAELIPPNDIILTPALLKKV